MKKVVERRTQTHTWRSNQCDNRDDDIQIVFKLHNQKEGSSSAIVLN